MPGCLYNRAWGTFWEWDNQIELGLVSNAATQNRSWWVKPMQVRKFRVECWDDRRVNQHSYKMMNIWRRPTVIWAKDAVTFLLFQRICPRQFALWLHRHGTMSRRTWVSSILSTCHVLAMPLVTTVGQLLILTCFRQLHLFFQTQQATWAASCTVQQVDNDTVGNLDVDPARMVLSANKSVWNLDAWKSKIKPNRTDRAIKIITQTCCDWLGRMISAVMPCWRPGHALKSAMSAMSAGSWRTLEFLEFFLFKKWQKKASFPVLCAPWRRALWQGDVPGVALIRGRVGWLELTCRKGDMI